MVSQTHKRSPMVMTWVYLDVYNNAAGTNVDIAERKNDIKFNKFNQFNTYPNF